MTFADLVGQTVFAIIPKMHPTMMAELKIAGAEAAGIWVESKVLTTYLLGLTGAPAIKTPMIFVPFHEMRIVVYASSENLSLSEKSFGL